MKNILKKADKKFIKVRYVCHSIIPAFKKIIGCSSNSIYLFLAQTYPSRNSNLCEVHELIMHLPSSTNYLIIKIEICTLYNSVIAPCTRKESNPQVGRLELRTHTILTPRTICLPIPSLNNYLHNTISHKTFPP